VASDLRLRLWAAVRGGFESHRHRSRMRGDKVIDRRRDVTGSVTENPEHRSRSRASGDSGDDGDKGSPRISPVVCRARRRVIRHGPRVPWTVWRRRRGPRTVSDRAPSSGRRCLAGRVTAPTDARNEMKRASPGCHEAPTRFRHGRACQACDLRKYCAPSGIRTVSTGTPDLRRHPSDLGGYMKRAERNGSTLHPKVTRK